MKKLIILLLTLTSLSSFGATIQSDCPELTNRIKTFNDKISMKMMNREIDLDAGSTVMSAVRSIDVDLKWHQDDIQDACKSDMELLEGFIRTAEKYFF